MTANSCLFVYLNRVMDCEINDRDETGVYEKGWLGYLYRIWWFGIHGQPAKGPYGIFPAVVLLVFASSMLAPIKPDISIAEFNRSKTCSTSCSGYIWSIIVLS